VAEFKMLFQHVLKELEENLDKPVSIVGLRGENGTRDLPE